MVACQLNMSSPVGPAEQFAGGSFPRSVNSLVIRFSAMLEDEQLPTAALLDQVFSRPPTSLCISYLESVRQSSCQAGLSCSRCIVCFSTLLLGPIDYNIINIFTPPSAAVDPSASRLWSRPGKRNHFTALATLFGASFGSCHHLGKLPTLLLAISSGCVLASWQPPQLSLHAGVPPLLSSPHRRKHLKLFGHLKRHVRQTLRHLFMSTSDIEKPSKPQRNLSRNPSFSNQNPSKSTKIHGNRWKISIYIPLLIHRHPSFSSASSVLSLPLPGPPRRVSPPPPPP